MPPRVRLAERRIQGADLRPPPDIRDRSSVRMGWSTPIGVAVPVDQASSTVLRQPQGTRRGRSVALLQQLTNRRRAMRQRLRNGLGPADSRPATSPSHRFNGDDHVSFLATLASSPATALVGGVVTRSRHLRRARREVLDEIGTSRCFPNSARGLRRARVYDLVDRVGPRALTLAPFRVYAAAATSYVLTPSARRRSRASR